MTNTANDAGIGDTEFNETMALLNAPVEKPKAVQLWAVQTYDTDSCSWEFSDECKPTGSKFNAEDDARQIKRKCCYPIRVRVVKW